MTAQQEVGRDSAQTSIRAHAHGHAHKHYHHHPAQSQRNPVKKALKILFAQKKNISKTTTALRLAHPHPRLLLAAKARLELLRVHNE